MIDDGSYIAFFFFFFLTQRSSGLVVSLLTHSYVVLLAG